MNGFNGKRPGEVAAITALAQPARSFPPIPHGGRLREAIARYGGAPEQWHDLSTAIAPWPYPVPQVPPEVWQRLPESNDGLETAIERYYGAAGLAVPGTQAALQWLPHLLPTVARVLVPTPSYGEYARVWALAGRDVRTCPMTPRAIDTQLSVTHPHRRIDALILAQPNNPTGTRWPEACLQRWHAMLAARGGWLILDEAFADAAEILAGQPSPWPARAVRTSGLVVLRSLGKFFGLAGLRFGVVFAPSSVSEALAECLGPWAVSHPARWAARLALSDRAWQRAQAQRWWAHYRRLRAVVRARGWRFGGAAPYFVWCPRADAALWWEQLAERQILVRGFDQPAALRFGLGDDVALAALAAALGV